MSGVPRARLVTRPDRWRQLARLRHRPLNFDRRDIERPDPADGWRLDDHRGPLPAEPPGDPVPGGSFDVACRLMRDYAFADPRIVRATFHRDEPLERRDMLLELRFRGLRFYVGVRVTGARDDIRDLDGRPARVCGWSYRTLAGHLETGEMAYETWKWLDTGEVEFRIHAVSRPGEGGSRLTRLGFRIFGRREQLKFIRRSIERMACLTACELASSTAGDPAREAAARCG